MDEQQQIEFQRINSMKDLDTKPKMIENGHDGTMKTLYPVFLEDKIVHLVLKKPKRIVVGVFSTESLADELIEDFEKRYGKREFYKRKLLMNKSVYQEEPLKKIKIGSF